MRRSFKALAIILSVILLSNTLGVSVYAEEEKPLVTQELETDQVIVTFKEDVISEEIDLDVVDVETVDTEEVATLKVPEGETVDTFIEELEEREDIESVEPDYLVQLTYTPNDPNFQYQYYHTNIETQRAWRKTMGSSDVVVAVLDSGFDLNHPDLRNQFVKPHSTADSGFSVDDHGTHVAGIIGSSIDNYAYGVGVAPHTSIMPIDVFVGESAYTSDVIEGIYQAVWAGADIINMSLGSYYYSYQFDQAVQYAYQQGLVIVAAAGNDATTRSLYPASYNNVISVGSTDSSNLRSYFSNYGYDIDIVAPGSSIYSTLPYNSGGWMSGTSMASPVVAGVAALIMANEPGLTNTEVVERLLTTAKDLGDQGKDHIYGNGLVNAKQALNIIEIPSPLVFGVSDYSTLVTGYVLYDIRNGTIIVRDQSGNPIASQENYNGYTYFNVTIPQQPAGTNIYVSVMDSYGNESEPVEVSIWDGTAPDQPEVHEVTDQSTRITGTGEPGTVVSVYVNDEIIYTNRVDENGNFEVSINPIAAGTKLSLNLADDAGNISEFTDVFVKDVTAPAKPHVNEVTENSREVSGTAEAGSTVAVKANGVLLGEASVDESGNYAIAIAKQKAGTLLVISSTDQAGNVSEATEIKVKDITAPARPTVTEVTDQSTVVKGTAEAGATILVKSAGTQIGKAVVGSNGSFAVTIAKQKAGTKLSVTATDATGNISLAKELIVIDITPPATPTVDQVTDQSTAVTGTGEVNASISVGVDGKEMGTAKVTADGKYKVAISAQKAGTKIQVTATDAAGNKSAAREVSVTDATPPETPTVEEVTDKSTTVGGTAEAGSVVVVKATGSEIGRATTSDDGNFAVSISKQKAGTKIGVTAVDQSGNVSGSKEITVIDITEPDAPIVNKVTDQSTEVTGSAEVNATITVKAGNNELGTAEVAADGKYKAAIAAQRAGTKIQVMATDAAGNSSVTTEVVVLDGTAPAVPTVNGVTDKSIAVTGTAEAASKISIKAGNKEIGTATVSATGKYSAAIAKQKAGTVLTIVAIDQAGNISKARTIKVIDRTAPSVPIVNVIADNSVTVSGKAESGAAVHAYAGSKKLGEALAKSGSYSIKIAKQKAGTVVTVYAVDAAGNKSGSKTTKVVDKTPPAIPSVNTVADNATVVKGKAETAATVYAYAGTKKLGEATAKNGVYSIKIAKQKAGTTISVHAVDRAKNKSGSKTIKVIDKTPPPVPTVNKVTSKSTVISGKGEKAATVFVYNGTKKIGQGTVDRAGNFKVKISVQKKGASLKVHLRDKAGNKSGSRTVKVY